MTPSQGWRRDQFGIMMVPERVGEARVAAINRCGNSWCRLKERQALLS
jgi:hypothetical protein